MNFELCNVILTAHVHHLAVPPYLSFMSDYVHDHDELGNKKLNFVIQTDRQSGEPDTMRKSKTDFRQLKKYAF